jgi:hypothetical protein
MEFDKSDAVDSVCQQMRMADWPRGQNRARINNLFNGFPPFNEAEAQANNINVNVNFLEGTVLSHDARAQFYGAFLKPGQFFTATTDMGRKDKRSTYSSIVTQEMNKIMKRSMVYFETFRSKFAMDVLHGIGPSAWRNADKWCPDAIAIEDVGIPGNTLLTMENMPFFYVYRSYTAPELMRLTQDRTKAKAAGWDLDMVDQCIAFVDRSAAALMGNNWPEVWSPEKTQERIKGDGGFYAGDQVPTIDCFDFYFYSDDGNEAGWRRRVILDAWSSPSSPDGRPTRNKDKDFSRGKFLFNPGKRKYADKVSELISFQFADLSSVAPFRYHSVRSLGFLVYAVCHLQNRIRCRFNESVFEALMNYYRVRSSDEAERALKLDLINRGFIDETIQFVPPNERWNVNAQLIELGMSNNKQIIDSNSSSYTQQQGGSTGDRKTKFQVMAEVSQTTALVQSAFNQAYQYQESEYREILRRFCKENSTDPDVRKFRATVAQKGVPMDILNSENWDIQPTRVMGAGNQTMETAIAQQLLQMRNLYDPEPQREILREITFNVTGDADKAARWVPDEPLKVSDSVHDAQLSMGTLMQGLPVAVKTGMNHKEYIGVMLQSLNAMIQQTEQGGGMTTQEKIVGFGNVAQHVEQHIQLLSQDPEEKQFVTAANQQLAKMMNLVKAFAQRLQEQMKKQQAQQGGDPQVAAKTQSQIILAKAKAQNSRESHSQKTAQKQVSFDMEQQRKQKAFELEQALKTHTTKHEITRSNMKSMNEG